MVSFITSTIAPISEPTVNLLQGWETLGQNIGQKKTSKQCRAVILTLSVRTNRVTGQCSLLWFEQTLLWQASVDNHVTGQWSLCRYSNGFFVVEMAAHAPRASQVVPTAYVLPASRHVQQRLTFVTLAKTWTMEVDACYFVALLLQMLPIDYSSCCMPVRLSGITVLYALGTKLPQ